MSDELKQAYASATETPIITVEFYHSAIGYIRLARANIDLAATIEDSSTVTFTGVAMRAPYPSKTTEGRQELNIQIDGASNIIYQKIAQIVEANRATQENVNCKFRTFLPSDLSAPVGPIYAMVVTAASINFGSVGIRASYAPVTNTAYPRNRYFTSIYPGLRYV